MRDKKSGTMDGSIGKTLSWDSAKEIQRDVAVIGKVVISGHYPEITENNYDDRHISSVG